jgi:hypothetical protein
MATSRVSFLHPLIFAFFFGVSRVRADLLIVFLERCKILAGLGKFTLDVDISR